MTTPGWPKYTPYFYLFDGVVAGGFVAVVRKPGRKGLPVLRLGGARRVAAYPADRPPAHAGDGGPRFRPAAVALLVDAAGAVAVSVALVGVGISAVAENERADGRTDRYKRKKTKNENKLVLLF